MEISDIKETGTTWYRERKRIHFEELKKCDPKEI